MKVNRKCFKKFDNYKSIIWVSKIRFFILKRILRDEKQINASIMVAGSGIEPLTSGL